MAAPTMQKKPVPVRRNPAAPAVRGQYSVAARSAAVERVAYPQRTAAPVRPVRPAPAKAAPAKPALRKANWARFRRFALRAAAVFFLCCVMLYRQAMILESNDHIQRLNQELAAAEASNQAIQSKIDQGLELGALEEYATTKLGMIRPDSSQVFYVDLRLADGAQNTSRPEEERRLEGTPGALVHAFEVLK